MWHAIIKRCADALEKLAIGSALIGIFQHVNLGLTLAVLLFSASIILTIMEQK